MKTCCVCVPITWSSVSRRFFESWVKLTGPKVQERLARDFDVKLVPMVETRFPLDTNRNQAVERALNDQKADFVQFVDADMTHPEDLIPRLLTLISDEFPITSGVYWLKKPPFRCIAGKYVKNEEISDFELKRKSLEREGFIAPDGSQTLYTTPIKSFDVIESVDVTGMGCLLVRSDVFGRLKQPYFSYVNEFSTGDYMYRDGVSEDMWFHSQCRKAGIKTLLDPSVRCGHLVERETYGDKLV